VIDVTVESQGHTHTFKAWLAATPSRHEQGLMYVNSLAANRGMLFVFDQPQPQAFWMKNTLIPLDILFIAPDGRVIRIAENAKPMSLETIQSMGIASEVLELAGGVSHNLGIVAGARIKHSDPSAAPAH